MKKLLFFSLALLLMGGVTAKTQDRVQYVHPNDAAYKIDGQFYFSVENDTTVVYNLTNIVGTGMTIQRKNGAEFVDVSYDYVLRGHQFRGEEVGFRFQRIITSEGFPGFKNISYWYFDPELQDWQRDTEIRKGELQQEASKQVTVMLIIDCSSSLGSDNLDLVKRASIGFLDRMRSTSDRGNIHIGIVAFSSNPDTKVFDLQPLTSNSYYAMTSFINGLTIKNGTALFRAWDKALKQTEDYTQNLLSKQQAVDKSYFVTFTDGIDQTSQDLKHRPRPIVSSDEYFSYIEGSDAKRKIDAGMFESDVVFVQGSDIENEKQMDKFEGKLKKLAGPNPDAHYTRLEGMSQLIDKFDEIASRLTESWKELFCYVAPARHGRVCWTFGAEEKVQVKKTVPAPVVKTKPKVKGKNFCGMSFGIGVNIYNWSSGSSAEYRKSISLPINVGFDYAWRLSDRFAMGLYTIIGAGPCFYRENSKSYGGYPNFDYDYRYSEGTGVVFNLYAGLLMLFGDLDNKPFILGVTPFTGFSASTLYDLSMPIEVRFGRVLSKHFYLTGYAKLCFETGQYLGVPFEAGLSFGYKF